MKCVACCTKPTETNTRFYVYVYVGILFRGTVYFSTISSVECKDFPVSDKSLVILCLQLVPLPSSGHKKTTNAALSSILNAGISLMTEYIQAVVSNVSSTFISVFNTKLFS